MKQLVCEMCGSADLMKQDGVFVCQSCGCKYSVEEARKMMIEGTVDVSGSTVKIDISEELKNLYQIARRSKDAGNNENAAKYYEMILIKDPSSWEANFYVLYYKAVSWKIGDENTAIRSFHNGIEETLRLVRDHVNNADDRINALAEIKFRANKISKILYSEINPYSYSTDPLVRQKIRGVIGLFPDYEIYRGVREIFADDEKVMRAIGVQILKERIAQKGEVDANDGDVRLVKRYDPDYQVPARPILEPDVESTTLNSESSGGCYVATAVYGSYDCPQVWTLRRFRDYTLAETWYGRAFIRIYYAISPTLVKWFGHTEWFKKMWKGKLDQMVSKLNDAGVENTPYNDKPW